LGNGLGRLATDACVDELAKMDEEEKEKERGERIGRPGMYGSMGYGSGMMYGEGYEDMMEEMDDMEDMEEDYEEMYGSMMYPGAGRLGTRRDREEEEDKGDETIVNRRRLSAHLNAVLVGLVGTEALRWRGRDRDPPQAILRLANAPPHSAYVGDVLTQIESLLKLCGNRKLDKAEFRTELENELASLRAAVDKFTTPTEAAEPAEEAQPAAAEEPAAAS
jgi:hypothetical protein